MNIKKYISVICILLLSLVAIGNTDLYGAKKKTATKAKTTAVKNSGKSKTTSTKRKTTSSKKKTTSTGKTTSASKSKKTASKTSSTKKRSTAKSSKKRKSAAKTRKRKTSPAYKPYTPPAEPILNDSLTMLVNNEVLAWIPENVNPGGLRINSVIPDRNNRSAKIGLNENFTYLPVTAQFISEITDKIQSILPDSLAGYNISLNVGPRLYAYYINSIDKLPEKFRDNNPIVTEVNPAVVANKGMDGDMVAMWPSHGRYYKAGSKSGTGGWVWQRPQLFQETEDTHTMAYIYPFAVPMLENAGAYVFLPRERDINLNEVIVDNDVNESGQLFSQPYYKEKTGLKQWATGTEDGFIYDLPDFRDTENPFENGTYRQTTTITTGEPSLAAWYADIPEDGEYAVYVSYKTLPNSTSDARYTVNYSGGTKEFIVNQTMGGSTWIYLGTFPLEAGYSDIEPVVTLSNLSHTGGKIVTADAVKIGGGMGNIARSDKRSDVFLDPSTPEEGLALNEIQDEEENDENEEVEDDEEDLNVDDNSDDQNLLKLSESNGISASSSKFKVSGMPRFLEGARYWLQWAGMPEYIYSPYHGTDDYKDDYTSRGHWVNYLAGGSRVLPNQDGLNIPIDVVMALHSDAGKRADDSFVGTLGIYYTNGGDSYTDGTPRSNSRTLTDMLMRQITGDIRQTWEPNWKRRSMWDKSYVEARVPEVPTSLIELLSHQNFADMRYALDPAFRFTVSRSIYKALGRFVAERKNRKFVVQPLPVKDFYISRIKKGQYRLAWQPTPDRLEPTAVPTKYVIMERTDDELGFHYLGETTSTHFDVIVEDTDIHSFRVIAANEGGTSFPSETLVLRESQNETAPILIINGFTRVSGPKNFSEDGEAGFKSYEDFGVPYINDIMFVGYQTEFRRNSDSFGQSQGDYATQVISGNTFDFPYLHGVSIAETGRGFVSSSVGAIVAGEVKLDKYKTIDLILGKQKTTVTGNGNTGMRFTAFPKKLQDELKSFTRHGGDLMVSGAYIASDLADYRSPNGSFEFSSEVLGIAPGYGSHSFSGQLLTNGLASVAVPQRIIKYSNTLNDKKYIVENPDILSPSGKIEANTFLTFSDTSLPAGYITKNGKSNGVVMSVPFESIEDSETRNQLMKYILDYLEK